MERCGEYLRIHPAGSWTDAGAQITLKFLNEEAKSIHGNVRLGSVFTGESGEWKLGGFEVLSSVADDEPFIYVGLCEAVLFENLPGC